MMIKYQVGTLVLLVPGRRWRTDHIGRPTFPATASSVSSQGSTLLERPPHQLSGQGEHIAAARQLASIINDNLPPNERTNETAKMDPYSAEGELINIHNYFHQGQYQEVIDYDTSALSSENELPARVLALRARIALGQAEDVIADVQGEKEPELVALGALAESALGKTDSAVKTIEKLAASEGENATVQIVGGTVLQAAGKSEEALALLSQHQGSCTFDSHQLKELALTQDSQWTLLP